MPSIASNVLEVKQRIAAAAKKPSRNPRDIKLVVAGKYATPMQARQVIKAGVDIIGENREQDLRQKFKIIGNQAHWHFIGHLQRNKVKSVIKMVSMIHSLDSMRLAEELEKRLKQIHKKLPALIEVNTSREKTKHGVAPNEAVSLAQKCSQFKFLKVVGLMTMGALAKDPEANRKHFASLRKLAQKIKNQKIPGVKMKHLSMGTTGDFEVAIEEGATLIRVGSAIFAS